ITGPLQIAVTEISLYKQFLESSGRCHIHHALSVFLRNQCINEPCHESVATAYTVNHLLRLVYSGNEMAIARMVGTIQQIMSSRVHKAERKGKVFTPGQSLEYLIGRFLGLCKIGVWGCVTVKRFEYRRPQHLVRRPNIAHHHVAIS